MSRQKEGKVYLDPVNTSYMIYSCVRNIGCSKTYYKVGIQSGDGGVCPCFNTEEEARAFMESVTELWKGVLVFKNADKDEFHFNLDEIRMVSFDPDGSTITVNIDKKTFRFEVQDIQTVKRTAERLELRPWQFLKLGPEYFGG